MKLTIGECFAMFSRTINLGNSCRANTASHRETVVLAMATGAARPAHHGPALAAEVVKNCGGKWAQLFKIAGDNRFILACEQREPFLPLSLIADCSFRRDEAVDTR